MSEVWRSEFVVLSTFASKRRLMFLDTGATIGSFVFESSEVKSSSTELTIGASALPVEIVTFWFLSAFDSYTTLSPTSIPQISRKSSIFGVLYWNMSAM